MKKTITLTVLVLLISATSVFAKKVRFRVDMAGQSISSNGVRVAGDFQAAAGYGVNWSPSATAMTNGGSGTIYSVTVDIPSGRFYEFKFINGNDWNGVESVPSLVRVGHPVNGGTNDNRWAFIDSTSADTLLLPAVLFGGSAPANSYAVRFSVDLNNLTIAQEGVFIAGSFTSWGSGQRRMANLFSGNKLYEYIAILSINSTHEYKFKNGDGGWESVPAACAVNGNRQVVANSNKAEPRVCISSCTFCPSATIPRFNALFVIDMTNSTCFGGFDSVTVAGNRDELTNWASGVKLIRQGTTNIYRALIQLDSGQLDFKFRFHKNGNTNWENGSNRTWLLSAADTLDLTCFGSQTPGACAPQPPPSTITFRVDLSNHIPDPQGRIYVMGNFQSPSWQAGALRMFPVAGAPGIFAVTVTNVCPASFSYNFLNGDSSLSASEETYPDTSSRSCLVSNGLGGFNRTYTRTSGSPVVLGFKFNRCQSICGTFATATPAGQTTICQGASVVINANTGSGFTYQWRNAGGLIPGATSSGYTATASGAYRAIVSNVLGCVDTSAAVNVIVNSLPSASAIAAGPTTFCQGRSVIINANTGSGLTYQWRNANGNISNANSASYNANASGTYKVVVTNNNGCSDSSAAVLITVNPLPNASTSASGITTFCQGKSVTLNTNAGSGLQYQWKDSTTGNIPNATTASFIATVSGVYKVIVINNNNCSDSSAAIKVTVNPITTATAAATGPTTFCEGNSVLINANTGASLYYQWLKETGAIIGSTSASYLVNATGAYKVVVTNLFGCSDTSGVVQVTVNPKPAVGQILGDSINLKPNTPYTYTVADQLNHNYSWFITNGLISSGQNTNSVTVQWTNNGIGSIKVIKSNPFACSDSSSKLLTIGNVGLTENLLTGTLKIYPNPASNKLSIEFPSYNLQGEEYVVRIANILGQLMYEHNLQGHITSIDASAFGNGVHILTIYDAKGKLVSTSKVSIIK
ncbi:MAG: T9SS type A sorting domain-containing protein [Sphingobacteriales bacterium]|jgi:hypothetical protein|nr:T9SS type A sorting domain-containing protein [Sphingobacteriales bacterium]